MTPPLLEVTDYRVGFRTASGRARAIDGVSLALDTGRTLGIVGESGSGKSVLARSIMGLMDGPHHIEQGSIRFLGDEIGGTDRQHLWGSRIGMVFQDPMTSLNPVMRIGRQLAEPVRLHTGLTRGEIRGRCVELLDSVGIPEPENRLRVHAHELSGGMRQRVMIAMALAGEPDLLIADEPTTALDVTVQKSILDLLGRLQESRGMAMILITHDLGVARGRTDDIIVLYAGRVMERSPTATLFETVRHPYTEALIAAVPSIRRPKHTPLRPIPGTPPSIVDPPRGCRFAPRCKYAQARCVEEEPPVEVEGTHEYACFFPVGTDRGAAALEANVSSGRTAVGLTLTDPQAGS